MSAGPPTPPRDDPEEQAGRDELRRAAEQEARQRGSAGSAGAQDPAVLLEELRIHQIELEMQNEELRRAQIEIEASQRKYFELFDDAPIGYVTIEERGVVKDANLTAATLLGTVRSRLEGRAFFARVHPGDRDVFQTMLRRSLSGGTTESCELRLLRADGGAGSLDTAPFWAAVESRPVRLDSESDGLLLVFSDIDDRKAGEREIIRLNADLSRLVASRTEERDALNRELEAFAYSIAHDVRTPLRAIDGFSAVALDEQEAMTNEGVDALTRVRLAARRLARLLDDLMGLSHLSQRTLEREAVDVTLMATELGEELAADNAARRVELLVAPGLTAWADPVLLRLLLRELLANAWKFTQPHAAALVEVGVVDDGGERAYFVRDDGVGFDMRYAEHLFGAFQRMHSSDQFPGSGIGLATVQRLVSRHGGRIWAEAAIEQGATFWFTLEERLPDAAQAPAAG